MSVQLNDRRIQVRLGPLLYSSHRLDGTPAHRIDFSVERTISKEPNTASITIYNPHSDEALSFLRARGVEQSVDLYAGWAQGGLGLLSKGNPVKDGVKLSWDGVESKLEVKIADGARLYAGARVSFAVPAGALLSEALSLAASAAGTPGVVVVPEEMDRRLPIAYKGHGRFADVVTNLTRSMDAQWSIQNGVLTVLGRDNTLPGTSPLFSPELGNIVGRPEMKGRDGAVFTVLLSAEMRPGVRFRVDYPGPFGAGVWKCVGVKHDGSAYEDSFYSVIEARPGV